MTNEHQTGGQRSAIRAIDEAQYLMDSARPTRLNPREPTPEELAGFVIDMLRTYAEVDLLDKQRSEALNVFGSLPADDATLEQFAKGCERIPALAQLSGALRDRIAQPHTLLSDLRDGFEVK